MEGSTSFYNTEEEFKKYLMKTSYYVGLQKNLLALLPPEAETVLDLGTGTGWTAIQMARKCQGVVHATDIRQEILDPGQVNRGKRAGLQPGIRKRL